MPRGRVQPSGFADAPLAPPSALPELSCPARLAELSRKGLVVAEGLIAHGRGEAFDYLLGERTNPSARRATRVAAQWLRRGARPVVSVNGNVAALAAPEVARLQRALPTLGVEVNLFHRSPRRVGLVARALRSAGVDPILGTHPTARIPGLPSDGPGWTAEGSSWPTSASCPSRTATARKRCGRSANGSSRSTSNPLSRTSQEANLPIVDELVRALRNLDHDVRAVRRSPPPGRFAPFNAAGALREARATIERRLTREAAARPRPSPRRR